MDNYEQYGQYSQSGSGVPANCTIEEYRKNYASAPLQKSIKTWAIVGYVLCAINAVLAVLVSPLDLVFLAIDLVLILGVHRGKKKGCAIGLLISAIISSVISLIMTGSFSGWLWIIMAVSFMSTFKKMDDEYKAAMTAAAQPTYEY